MFCAAGLLSIATLSNITVPTGQTPRMSKTLHGAHTKRKPVELCAAVQTQAEIDLYLQLRQQCKKPDGTVDFCQMATQFDSTAAAQVSISCPLILPFSVAV